MEYALRKIVTTRPGGRIEKIRDVLLRRGALLLLCVLTAAACRRGAAEAARAPAASAAARTAAGEQGHRASEAIRVTVHPRKDEDPCPIRGRDGRYYLAWCTDRAGNADIWIASSRDARQWDAPRRVTGPPHLDYYPSLIQARDGRFHLVWFRQDARTRVRNIFYANSPDAVHWSDPKQITLGKKEDWIPCLMEDAQGVLWVAWCSRRTGNREIFIMRSSDDGATWGEPVQVTRHPDRDDFPCLAQSRSGEYVLAWTRYRSWNPLAWLPNGSAEILYATSRNGVDWGQPIAITHDKYTDAFPALFGETAGVGAAAGKVREGGGGGGTADGLFVAWTSNRFGPRGDTIAIPLADAARYPANAAPLFPPDRPGYTARFAPTDRPGVYLMAWVSAPSVKPKNLEIYCAFVRP